MKDALVQDGVDFIRRMSDITYYPDPDVQMATTIRRALLSIVGAIEKRYDLPDSRERSNYCNKRKEGV